MIEINDITLSYKSGDRALTVLDIPFWRIDKGAQAAIFGPSGSGKSTLLNIFAGLLLPETGTVQIAGKEINKMSETERDHFRAQHIGYIFQNFNLLQGYTALENVLIGMSFSSIKSDKAQAKEVLKAVGLSHREHHHPRDLSIGEQQRVAIARALIKKPDIILADEPTGSLDPLHTGAVIQRLREASNQAGCTLIVVSHEKDVVSTFDNQVSFLKLNEAFKETGGAR